MRLFSVACANHTDLDLEVPATILWRLTVPVAHTGHPLPREINMAYLVTPMVRGVRVAVSGERGAAETETETEAETVKGAAAVLASDPVEIGLIEIGRKTVNLVIGSVAGRTADTATATRIERGTVTENAEGNVPTIWMTLLAMSGPRGRGMKLLHLLPHLLDCRRRRRLPGMMRDALAPVSPNVDTAGLLATLVMSLMM